MGIVDLDNGSLKTVRIVTHSHHDYAWCVERQWHIRRYCLLMNSALDWLAATPGATFMIDNVIHSLTPFFDNCPDRVEEFKALVKAGRIYVANGGYSLARPSYVGEETFIRNLVAGDEYFKRAFGLDDIPFYNNLDTASGQRQIPQILTLAGLRYYRFQRPEKTLDKWRVPRTFHWKGLDGSTVLVSRAFGCGFLDAQYTNLDFDTQWEEIRERFYNEELLDRRIDGLCPSDTELLAYGCDDSCPPLNWFDRPIRLDAFIKEWNRRESTVRLEYSTPGAYFEDLEKKDLPVYEGGLDDAELTFNLPAKGDRSMWRLRGDLDKLLVRLENVCAMCSLAGEPNPEETIRELWYQLFEITGHAIDWVHRRDDVDLMNIAVNARTKAETLLKQYLECLASLVAYGDDLLEIVVNTQSRERREVVQLYISFPQRRDNCGYSLRDAWGNTLDYQIVRHNSLSHIPAEIRRTEYYSDDVLVELTVPAFGYNAVYVVSETASPEALHPELALAYMLESEVPLAPETVVDNGRLAVTLAEGRIVSVTDNVTAKTAAAPGGSLFGLRCVQTKPFTDWLFNDEAVGERAFVPHEWKFIETGPVRWRYRVTGAFMDGHTATVDMLIEHGAPAIEFELTLDTQPAYCYYTADFRCDRGTRTYADVFFGVEPRDVSDMICSELEATIPGQIYGRNFTLFENGTQPMALVSGDCSVYYIHDMDSARMSLFLARNCVAESHITWVRNIDSELMGKNHFHFSLMLPRSLTDFSEVQQYTKSYHHPLLVGMKANRNPQGLPAVQSLLSNTAAGLIQSALYRKGEFLYLRLFETNGRETSLDLQTPDGVRSVEAVDFLDRPMELPGLLWDTGTHHVTGTVGAFKIVTLKMGMS